MAVRATPTEAMDRWVNGLVAAGPKITAGVEAVTTSPGVLAARASTKWVASMADPATQAKWKRNVGALSLETWKSLMKEVGIPRIASGAQAKKGKYLAFAEKFFPFLSRVVSEVEAMDSSSFSARVNRAVQFMTLTHAYAGQG